MGLKKVGILNVLLVFVPIALVLRFAGGSATWIFVISCLAIIPLAGLMGKATEHLAEKMGPGIGGLMNASFGNAAELIIALFALRAAMFDERMIDVVKASITGSILGNALLVLGASFLWGGMRHQHQKFNATAAGLAATLLALAAVGLLVPALFHAHLEIHHQHADEQGVSLEIAIVLFVVYVLMLLFSLKTHTHLYDGQAESHNQHLSDVEGAWSTKRSVITLLAATTMVAVMSELLIGAVEETRTALGWTHLFVGVVVIAVVGNAAEHSTAILVARKNQMDLAFQIAVGSSLQIALFVAPVLMFISYLPWFPQLDLQFSMLEVAAIAVSVLVVGMVAYDGESNWMEGLLLIAVYVILGIAFYHLPETHEADTEKAGHSVLESSRLSDVCQAGSSAHSVLPTVTDFSSWAGWSSSMESTTSSTESERLAAQAGLGCGLGTLLGSGNRT
ncbi:MAG: calcium/proton exchanger [Planctomycetaceae bacterium]|nr:calcium/proton exchanger [Planctomycetaceae bacterium]